MSTRRRCSARRTQHTRDDATAAAAAPACTTRTIVWIVVAQHVQQIGIGEIGPHRRAQWRAAGVLVLLVSRLRHTARTACTGAAPIRIVQTAAENTDRLAGHKTARCSAHDSTRRRRTHGIQIRVQIEYVAVCGTTCSSGGGGG